MHVRNSITELLEQVERVGSRNRGVRNVESDVRVVGIEQRPRRRIGAEFDAARAALGKHVLDRKDDVGLVVHADDAFGECLRI